MIRTDYLKPLFDKDNFNKLVRRARKALKGVPFESIAVVGNSGTLFGGALAYSLKKKLTLVRKDPDKYHSHCNREVEGDDTIKSYLFVDDFVGSGQTLNRAVKLIDKTFRKAKCIGVYLYKNDLYIPESNFETTTDDNGKITWIDV